MIKAIIFDFDGIIIDTETPDYVSWQEEFQANGVELDPAIWTRFIGGISTAFDVFQHLENLIGQPVDQDAIRRRRRKRFLDLIDANPVLPGIMEYINDAKSLNLRVGIASASDRRWVEGHLRARSMLDYFDLVRVKDDVNRVKPDPELYSSSVGILGVEPRMAIAIEDSANGVTAAKDAGLFCVVVTNPMTESLPVDHADLRLGSLEDLPLTSLLSHIEALNR